MSHTASTAFSDRRTHRFARLQHLLELLRSSHDGLVLAHADLGAVALVDILKTDDGRVGLDQPAELADRNDRGQMELQIALSTLDTVLEWSGK